MKPFELRLRFPVGSVMVGGYSPTPRDVHGAHATDRHRRPLIPATALRGALREALEGILRGVGEHICSGGDGIDPEASNGTPASVECSLDNGQRCKACRLFGSRRGSIDQDEHAFSALILGDALLEGEHDVRPQTRPGVSISRNRRSAEENRLYMHHVPSTPNAYFKAEGILLDPSMEHLFQAAVRSTTHIGAGRSRGLARVEIEPPDWRELSSDNARLPTSSDVRIRVTLLSPASIGAPVVHPNLRQTRYEIPGSALRGAIGFALAAMLDNPNEDQAFQALVSEDGARFGFLYPVDNATADVAGPLPITTAACKEKKLQHGIVDTLLDRLTVAVVTDATQMERVERDIASECKICRQPLRALSGWRRRTNSVPDRLVTRVSLDRTRTSARDEFLFSQVLLDTGTTFEGLIRDVPDRGRAHLARALASHLSLGRGRSAGWGRVSIEVLEPQAALPLSQRAIEFEKALTVRFERATLATDICQRLVPITLMSPLLSTEGDGESLLSRALSAVRCLSRHVGFLAKEGGISAEQECNRRWVSVPGGYSCSSWIALGEKRSRKLSSWSGKASDRDGIKAMDSSWPSIRCFTETQTR
ncbi:MAG: hypothetical protein IPM54_38380 [Polyangiaceae bacterium]|nr:hypothetical protein [Polyangiaceae bacterium]